MHSKTCQEVHQNCIDGFSVAILGPKMTHHNSGSSPRFWTMKGQYVHENCINGFCEKTLVSPKWGTMVVHMNCPHNYGFALSFFFLIWLTILLVFLKWILCQVNEQISCQQQKTLFLLHVILRNKNDSFHDIKCVSPSYLIVFPWRLIYWLVLWITNPHLRYTLWCLIPAKCFTTCTIFLGAHVHQNSQ